MSLAGEAKEKPQQPVPLPSGTVTFLFTDIEGSTQRWDQHRAAMRPAVERHDVILRREIEARQGYVFKTVGDAFCAAFRNADDALVAAINAQRQLAKEDFSTVDGLRVRMGLHAGKAVERGDDYFGPEVNRVARLMSIGHGGQVLISSAVYDLIEGHLPDGASLVDLGLRRLKDLTLPEHVWQLSVAGLPVEFPPLDSLDARPNNLPVQVTALLGRERELGDLKDLLGQHRLVTITGAGGVGKTRIALQVAADMLDHFADGVWFADMAPITDPELVSSVVASALDISQVPGQPVEELIPQRLKRKKLLLIIDNCEHLLEPIAVLADAIHHQAPSVRILTTSRQPLGIPGEATHRLPSLAVPESGPKLDVSEAMRYGSIAVFVDRARLADARFGLSNDNAPIVAEICRRLDGIPLAIELAAARVKVLSIPNLAHRLNERFRLLTGGSRTALPRQKTLAALIDWSYDLLTPREQRTFARLSIFAGGFGLDAVTSVCGSEEPDELEVLDLLTSLADKSLLIAETSSEQSRYHLLESTRAYGLEKLTAAEEREHLSRRHARYYRDRAKAADERWGKGSTFEWLLEVETDLDNYRAALEWSLTRGNDVVLGGAIAASLARLWRSGGLTVEGRYWIELALKRISQDEHPEIAARLWRGKAHLTSAKAKVEAAEHALALYESIGDVRGLAWAELNLSFGLFQMGRLDEADTMIGRAYTHFQEIGYTLGITSCIQQQASIADMRGDLPAARTLCMQAISEFRALGNETGVALALGNLGELEFKEGRLSEAVRFATDALQIHQRGRDKHNLTLCSLNLALYRIALGDIEDARLWARQGLNFAWEIQNSLFIVGALQHLTLIAALSGKTEFAGRLLGHVDAQYKASGIEREITEQWGYDALMTTLRLKLSEAEIEKLAAQGAEWSEDHAVEEALKV